MSKAEDRIGAVDLYSHTRPLAREEQVEVGNAFRWICAEHVRIFGLDIAMYLLWRKPIPRRDNRIKLAHKHTLYAKTVDNVSVGRTFYPAKYGNGRCYCCGKQNCTAVGCALTRWGSAWARYECWAEEMRWIDSHEFHRRERLTEACEGLLGHGRWAGSGTPKLAWADIEERVNGAIPIPVVKTQEYANDEVSIFGYPAVEVNTIGNPTGELTFSIEAHPGDRYFAFGKLYIWNGNVWTPVAD